MPIRTRRYTRRFFGRRRRPFRRFRRFTRRRRYAPRRTYTRNKVYRFSRNATALWDEPAATTITTISSNNTSFENHALTFHLSDLPDYQDFTSLYDQYKITGVSIKFIPVATESMTNLGTFGFPTYAYLITDTNDASNITSETQAAQYQGSRILKMGQQTSHFIRPKTLVNLYESSVSTGYGNPKFAPWVSTDDPDVDYYGLKIFIPQSVTGLTTGWRIMAKFYLAFRSPK